MTGREKQQLLRKRVVHYGEVFTPEETVRAMVNVVKDKAATIDKLFLEPACGTGNFLAELLRTRLHEVHARFFHDPIKFKQFSFLALSSLYGIDLLADNVARCRNVLRLMMIEHLEKALRRPLQRKEKIILRSILRQNIIQGNALSQQQINGEPLAFSRWQISDHGEIFMTERFYLQQKRLPFSCIIGNPPYQMVDRGAQASAKPIYHLFIERAITLMPETIVMIVPSRWFTAGKGLNTFRKRMLTCRRIKEIHDFPNAKDIFPNVDIKGGVHYFLWERDYEGDATIYSYENGKIVSTMKRPLKMERVGIFVRHNRAISILQKVLAKNERSFRTIVSARKPFGIPTNFTDITCTYKSGAVKVYAHRKVGWLRSKSVITRNQHWVNKWKVYVPYAFGSGLMMQDEIKPIIGEPNSCATETYLVIGPVATKKEAESICRYMRTKFFHFLIGLRKVTQHATKKVYEFAPLQDFSTQWTDETLYKKYGFTDEEIAYLEEKVPDMT